MAYCDEGCAPSLGTFLIRSTVLEPISPLATAAHRTTVSQLRVSLSSNPLTSAPARMFKLTLAAAAATAAHAVRMPSIKALPSLDDLAELEQQMPVPGKHLAEALRSLPEGWKAVTDLSKYEHPPLDGASVNFRFHVRHHMQLSARIASTPYTRGELAAHVACGCSFF